MRRRDFLGVIGGAMAWPTMMRAEQRTAKALGITVPPALLALADDMIE